MIRSISRPFAIISILFAWMVLACSPAAQPTAPGEGTAAKPSTRQQLSVAPLEEPGQPGGKLNMAAAVTVFGTLNDPHLVATFSGRDYSTPIANGIVKRDLYNVNYPIVPDLAEKWEVSKDGLAYTFTLRQGIKFHNVAPVNAREFTSEDAKYTLLRLTADPSIVPEKSRPRFQRRNDFGFIKSIETPDKYTMVVNMKEPYSPFLDAVAHGGSLVIPKEFVDKFPDGLILEGMIGTGPYLPDRFIHQQLMTFKKNPEYWNKDSKGNRLPYLDEVSYVVFGDEQSRLASFRAGQIDTSEITEPTTLEVIQKENPGINVLYSPVANLTTFRFNMKLKPFQDVRVRRAVHLVVDRHQFVELFTFGRGVVAGPVTPLYADQANTMDWLLSQPGYRKDKTQDIAEAKRLMKEAGYESGLEIAGLFTAGGTSGDLAAVLADQLKVLSITFKPELVDYAGGWVPRSTNGDFELSYMGHTLNVDADSLLSAHLHNEGGRNYGKFDDPKLNDLIVKQRTTVNLEERKKLVQEAEKYILETAPMIFVYQATRIYMAQPWVHNVSIVPGLSTYNSVDRAWVEKR